MAITSNFGMKKDSDIIDDESTELAEYNSDIVLGEMNFHLRASFIFPPATSKNLDDVRSMTIAEYTGDPTALGKIIITPPVDGQCYTNKTYDVITALTRIWRDAGEPDDILEASFYQLHKAMNKLRRPAGHDIALYKKELLKCSRNLITWEYDYMVNVENQRTRSGLKDYRILEHLDIFDERDAKTKKLLKTGFEFKFGVKNIANLTNPSLSLPINMATRLLLRSNDTASSLWPIIENITAGFINDAIKNKTNRFKPLVYSIESIFRKLPDLEKSYSTPSSQKRLFSRLAKCYDGLELSIPGYTANAIYLPRANPKNGYKLVITINAPEQSVNTFEANPHKIQEIVDMLMDFLSNESDLGFYYKIARSYSHNFVQSTIGEVRERYLNQSMDPIDNIHAYFADYIHRKVHNSGLNWIIDCGDKCHLK